MTQQTERTEKLMKMTRQEFSNLVNKAMSTGTSHMRPVIEKELLHYDILFCLDKAGLLDQLVFQGGTSLRLCYNGNRFSEDLDFAGGKDFSSRQLMEIKHCIEDYIGARYGLEVSVKEPSSLKREPHYAELNIDKWQISVITAPEKKSIPHQRVKIEVANIPAYTRQPLPLKKNYPFLPDGYEDTLIFTETLNEIMADKLIAFPATRKYIRYRDIWDLAWLQQQGAELDVSLVKSKINDHRLLGHFETLLQARLSAISTIVHGPDLFNEMKRFLPSDVFGRTLAQPKFSNYLEQTISSLLARLANTLYGIGAPTNQQFNM